MRVLWFSNTSANADEYFSQNLKGTGGWLKALNVEMQDIVDLHIAFYSEYDQPKFRYQNTTYHPIPVHKNIFTKVLNKFWFIPKGEEELGKYMSIIDKVKPDIIHIHGTESPFISIITHTEIPVVVSIQGNITVYLHKFFSGFEMKYLNFKNTNANYYRYFLPSTFRRAYNIFVHQSKIEQKYLSQCKYIIGRTDWDRRITRILAPKSEYFINNEILREGFYEAHWQAPEFTNKFIIHTTNGNNLYKGFETLCHSLKLLNDIGFSCEWRVAGTSQHDHIYELTRKKLQADFPIKGLVLLGSLNEKQLISKLIETNLFVMVSHIENSPNSLCEAMLLSIPCLSTFVGGTGSLVKDNVEGTKVQSGDPWALAGAIIEIAANYQEAVEKGTRARIAALQRHNKLAIANDLKNIYTKIILQSK